LGCAGDGGDGGRRSLGRQDPLNGFAGHPRARNSISAGVGDRPT
jgi:hypothetical protein